jgi:EAL domain-containing protein (putative c-di-GMP-specific phosphodiesterase class I)
LARVRRGAEPAATRRARRIGAGIAAHAGRRHEPRSHPVCRANRIHTANPQLARRVAGLLTHHQLPPSLLTLEVTESGFIEDPVSALAMLDALAKLRVLISIDDFGTGDSSLSHLASMPADEVKIDRSLCRCLTNCAHLRRQFWLAA